MDSVGMEIQSPDQILAPLNDAQRLAVQQIGGPMLVLAGPGSGKTRVITHRIAFMIAKGVPSHQIVALTFTNKAAKEMKTRIDRLAPGNRVWAGTFHRFCSRMLRRHADMVGLRENFTIYDSGDSRKVIKMAIENSGVDPKHYSPDRIANEISNVKNKAITSESFEPRPGHSMDAIIAKVYPEYQNLLRLANGVDFDDLLLFAVDLLRKSPELRQALDDHFRYMMVDEYQDTNLAQYQLVRLLNHSHQNLAVTGDPDQSIYGWRGANIDNILHFERDYQNVAVIRLEENYRSTQSILRVADQLITNNLRRKKKSLFTENAEGDPVRLVSYPSPNDEAIDIADSIALAVSQGKRKPGDFAVLYRANYLSRVLEHSLRSAGVPYQIVNGHEFYQRKEIKDVIAYLHLLNNESDTIAFERIVNIPSRKIGKVTLGRLRRFAFDHSISLLEAGRRVDEIDTISKAPSTKIREFVELIESMRPLPEAPVQTIIETVLERTRYQQWLVADGSAEGHERSANVDELIQAAKEYDRDHPDDGGLEAYLEQTSLVADTDVFDAESDYVTLMTLHAAKGLEFPVVYIVGLEDGILPHERSSSDENEVEEERRLFFVGITRAEQQLQISRCMNRFRRGSNWPVIASRFLMELPRHEMQVFEPTNRHSYAGDVSNAIADLEPWDDLPAIDINDDEPGRKIQTYSAGQGEPEKDGQTPEIDQVREMSNQLNAKLAQMIARKKGQALVDDERHTNGESDDGNLLDGPGNTTGLLTGAELEARIEAFAADRILPEHHEVGMLVEHPEYGIGQTIEITGAGSKRTGTFMFESGFEKSFVLGFVNLRRPGSSEPA